MRRTAKEFRDAAWKTLTGRYWWAVLAALVAGILGGYMSSSPISLNLNFSVGDTDLTHFGNWLHDTQTFAVNAGILRAMFGLTTILIVAAFTVGVAYFLVGSAVELGFNLYNISLYTVPVPGQPKFELLFSRFTIFGRALALRLLMFLKIFAWTLLFIVPGIVAAYRYAMAPYLLAEHPEMTAMEAIELSKQMMGGNKGRLFGLQLSFIGWYLLAALSFGIGWIFLAPYTKAADAAFYMELTGRLPQNGTQPQPGGSASYTPPAASAELPKPEGETTDTEWV